MTSRTSDRARCLSGSGRIRVRLSRVSQRPGGSDVVEVLAGGLHQPVGGARDLLGGLRVEDQPQRGAGFLDVAGHPVGDQTVGWHGDELGDEQLPLPRGDRDGQQLGGEFGVAAHLGAGAGDGLAGFVDPGRASWICG